MYYCYILYPKKLDKYYIGSTNHLQGRLDRHNCSKRGFTSSGKPWEIRYYEEFEDKHAALKREFQIKRWKSREAIEDLIGQE